MSLIFYYAPMSSSNRVHWALEELGVPYEKVKVNLAAGDQKKPEFLALNPNGKVPVLVAEGSPIFESLAILLYLGERFGVEKGLFPKEGPLRPEAFKWMAWASVTLGEAGGRILRNTGDRFPADQQNAKVGELAKRECGELLGMVDAALEGKQYLLGEEFSLVDLSIAGYLPFFARIGVDLGPHKRVQEWLARCTARPALAKAMQG